MSPSVGRFIGGSPGGASSRGIRWTASALALVPALEAAVALAATGEAVAVGAKDPKAASAQPKQPSGPLTAPVIASAIATARLGSISEKNA